MDITPEYACYTIDITPEDHTRANVPATSARETPIRTETNIGWKREGGRKRWEQREKREQRSKFCMKRSVERRGEESIQSR